MIHDNSKKKNHLYPIYIYILKKIWYDYVINSLFKGIIDIVILSVNNFKNASDKTHGREFHFILKLDFELQHFLILD